MVNTDGAVCTSAGGAVYMSKGGRRVGWDKDSDNLGVPDLNHPGVLGFLIEDVRKAWGYGRIGTVQVTYGQFGTMLVVETLPARTPVNSSWASTAEAMVVALEAAA